MKGYIYLVVLVLLKNILYASSSDIKNVFPKYQSIEFEYVNEDHTDSSCKKNLTYFLHNQCVGLGINFTGAGFCYYILNISPSFINALVFQVTATFSTPVFQCFCIPFFQENFSIAIHPLVQDTILAILINVVANSVLYYDFDVSWRFDVSFIYTATAILFPSLYFKVIIPSIAEGVSPTLCCLKKNSEVEDLKNIQP